MIPIPVIDLLKLAEDIVGKYITLIRAASERRWEQVQTALEMLTELTGVHIKAINEVVEPLVERRDLRETCRLYRLLVNNTDLPRGYGEARGILEGALELKQFRSASGDDSPVQDVLDRLLEFQQVAFLLRLNSWIVKDMLERMEQLWLAMSGSGDVGSEKSVHALRERVQSDLTMMIDWLRVEYPDAGLGEMTALETADDVVDATRSWCKGWQRHAQTRLYGGRGLDHAIGKLKIMH